MTAVLNKPSEAVMQRLGMLRDGTFDHPGIEVGHPLRPHVLYRIGADLGRSASSADLTGTAGEASPWTS